MSAFNFNPSYSIVQNINFASADSSNSLNIARQNTECVFERIEFVENVNDVFPNGVIIVKDTKDIVTFINSNAFTGLKITFFNGQSWDLDITSVSYLNNAASDTEESFVGIYFTNKYYIKSQSSSLNEKLNLKKPNVFKIADFVSKVKTQALSSSVAGYNDETLNYVLYRPLNTLPNRTEAVSDNAIEYLNYLTTTAVSKDTNLPTFMFWTGFDGLVNFKAFKYNLELADVVHRFAIYNGDSTIQKLSDGKEYRKIYFYNTNPAYQYISKNYYYVRKTPKVLDDIPTGLCFAENSAGNSLASEGDAFITKTLTYQFQDEGERYNIEVVGPGGSNSVPPGSDQLVYPYHWGYYDNLNSINDFTRLTLLGHDFGTSDSIREMNFMGSSDYMPYVDNTEMWKNIFDLTTVHPDFPNSAPIAGIDTRLQKIINLRYKAFLAAGSIGDSQLENYRKMELQNFIAYSLCCMGQDHDCFFALLQRYEVDSTKTFPTSVNGKMYRYKWNKLMFAPTGPTGSCGGNGNSESGSCGAGGNCGPSGSSGLFYFHHVESWTFDILRSSEEQDESWAINLNERGLTPGYLPPGWVNPLLSGFNYRPIGANQSTLGTGGDIFHLAKICKYTDGENYLYYFIAENVVDGNC